MHHFLIRDAALNESSDSSELFAEEPYADTVDKATSFEGQRVKAFQAAARISQSKKA